MQTYLEDDSGIYRIDHISAITPLPLRQDRTDQAKVTAINTVITTVGGHTHQTNISFEKAKKAFLENLIGPSEAPAINLGDPVKS